MIGAPTLTCTSLFCIAFIYPSGAVTWTRNLPGAATKVSPTRPPTFAMVSPAAKRLSGTADLHRRADDIAAAVKCKDIPGCVETDIDIDPMGAPRIAIDGAAARNLEDTFGLRPMAAPLVEARGIGLAAIYTLALATTLTCPTPRAPGAACLTTMTTS